MKRRPNRRPAFEPRRPAELWARRAAARLKFFYWLLAALALGLIARLVVVQILQGPTLARRALEQRLSTIDMFAPRGSILDRDGVPLVRSLPSSSVYAAPREVTDPAATAKALATILGGSAARIESDLASRSENVLIGRKVSHEAAELISQRHLSGVSIVAERTGERFVPGGRLASTLIGFTGIDDNGLAGVEYEYDDLLRGAPGRMTLETDQFDRALPFAVPRVVVAPRPGDSVVLTIDSFLQYSVERELHAAVARWHARSGTAIVMDPWTGEVLALADDPNYDIRTYGRFSEDARRNRAVMDAYEPGSTFKLITAAAALDSGKVTTSDRFPARDEITIGGRTIHNAEDGLMASGAGSETLGDIVVYSHNVGAAEVALAIGRHTMDATIRRFGFGEITKISLPGESPGIVTPLDEWSATSLPTMAFGHSIAVTPLALARAYCAIANGGILLRPRIISAVLDAQGRTIRRFGRLAEGRVISERTAATLRSFLRGVVTRGTGRDGAQVAGYTTAGKTGTAQIPENGGYAAGGYIASFIGYVPADVPRYLILVKVDRPSGAIYGGAVAAPVFARIARIAMMHAGILPAGPRLVKDETVSKRRI